MYIIIFMNTDQLSPLAPSAERNWVALQSNLFCWTWLLALVGLQGTTAIVHL